MESFIFCSKKTNRIAKFTATCTNQRNIETGYFQRHNETYRIDNWHWTNYLLHLLYQAILLQVIMDTYIPRSWYQENVY